MQADVDPALCPLCGRTNRCAVAAGSTCASCWCATATIGAETLQRLPEAVRDRACICAECAAGMDAKSCSPAQRSAPMGT